MNLNFMADNYDGCKSYEIDYETYKKSGITCHCNVCSELNLPN